MPLESPSKIQLLYQASQRSPLLTSEFLEELEIYPQLRYEYLKSGWLTRLGHGVFKPLGKEVNWHDAVRALQDQLKLPLHLGAKTAFQLGGASHYLSDTRIYLFVPQGVHVSKWFLKLNCVEEQDVSIYHGNPIKDWKLGLEKVEGMTVSALERAALEQLHFVGTKEAFDESYKLFEFLTALRPTLMQKLLESCSSIKAKRLFLYFAERLNYPWFKKLTPSKIALGVGPRVIDKEGKFDSKYQIIVPELD